MMKDKTASRIRSIVAHVVLIILSFMCLFFFYVLIVNASHSHAELQKGFSALPGKYFWKNLMNVANDGSFPMFRGILNSIIVSGCSAVLCTYFSSLTAYGLYAYDFKARNVAFTFIMAILVMPTQVTAMGFLRLITKMGLYDSLLPLIIPSVASPAVFYFMYSYLQSSLPMSLVEAARIDGCTDFGIFMKIILPVIKPAMASWGAITLIARWNDFFWPLLYLRKQAKYTLMVTISLLPVSEGLSTPWPVILAGTTLVIIPIIVLYLILERFQKAGMMEGAVKG